MAVNEDIFSAGTDASREAFAIEDLVFSVQIALQQAMRKQGVGYKQLAERLGMSPARVSQIFAENGPNLTLKTIARIQNALGSEFVFVEKSEATKALPPQKKFDSTVKTRLAIYVSGNTNGWPILEKANSWNEVLSDAA